MTNLSNKPQKPPLLADDRIINLPDGWDFYSENSKGIQYVNDEEQIKITVENSESGIQISAKSGNTELVKKVLTDPVSANVFALALMKKNTGVLNVYGRPKFRKDDEVFDRKGNLYKLFEVFWDSSTDKYGYYLSADHKSRGIPYYEEEVASLLNKYSGERNSLETEHSPAMTEKSFTSNEEIKQRPKPLLLPEAPKPIEIKKPLNLLIHDNFFKQNPDHILGKAYKASGRFGEVTKYQGDMNILNSIDTSGVLPFWEDNTTASVVEEDISELTSILDVEISNNIQNAIDKSEKSVTEKVIARSKKKIESVKLSVHELLSFEDVFKHYNPEISEEELKAFIWYKMETGQPLSEYWNSFYPEANEAKKGKIGEWVENGILCYYKGDLIPAYLFFAENLWERIETLDSDKKDIVELYGQEVYERQYNRLKKLFNETVYQRRLILDDTDESKRLILLPTSDFSNQFQIKSLTDEQPFKVKPIKKQDELGKPDFLNDHKLYGDYQRKVYDEFTLSEGFQYWMVKNNESINFKKGTSYLEIINIYLKQKQMPPVKEGEDKAKARAEWERKRSRAKEEGDRLFGEFLTTQILPEDKKRIEREWNSKFNGYQRINYNKVPVAFRVAKTYRNEAMEIRAEKREGVAFLFSEGSACIAYDVGFGKTWTAIFSIAQFIDSGYCKRPFIVVPNQTYKQWLSEIKGILPHIPINDLYNLSNDYLDELKGKDGKIEMVKENSISVLTYEGFEKIGFSEETISELILELYEILNQGGESEKEKSEKQKASFRERLEMIIGRGLKGTMVQIEDLGFDFMAVDEAHAMKKIFTSVKGEAAQEGKRERMRYKINSGKPSSIGLKGFMIGQYILKNNNYRNILLLTATPFTNSPLEVFSILALVAYKKLEESEVNNLTNFFDNYIQVSNELIINSKLRPERKEIVTGFNNIPALQTLIFRFVNFKNADTKDINGNKVKIVRPDKYVLPLKRKIVNGEIVELNENEQINTALALSPLQEDLMSSIKKYVEGKITYSLLCSMSHTGSLDIPVETFDEEEIQDATEGVEINEEDLNDSEKNGVRTLRGMNLARNLALSPYLHKCSGLGSNPTYLQYIETSPKLHYVMLCIKSVKDYHESRNQPVSGQVIYMDRGIEYFHLIGEYLVKVIGYKTHEIGIIKSQMKGGKSAKENIKNKFLGMEYDEKTRTFKDIPDSERIKVVIGSSTIKEGINLQRKSTVLYDCFVDWNPTDMIQLEGRIWRQGNEFGSVRITIPLMENSMDIFLFQKLEEKTKRINQIWDIDNQSSVLKLEEINPAELKYELISDPVVIAELETKEKSEKLRDSIGGIQYEIKRIESIKELAQRIESNTERLRNEVKLHREVKDIDNASVRSLIEKINEIFKSQLDINGVDFKHKNRFDSRSPYRNGYFKPYWFNDFVIDHRNFLKESDNYLIPKNLTIDTVDLHKQKLEKEIKTLEKRIEKESSEDAIRFRAGEIEEERRKKKYEKKTLEERVEEFKRLNYLLDHKQVKETPKVIPAVSCPPLDMSGNRRIDKEAIDLLEKCVLNLPQTKALHTIRPDEYTEERLKLHEKIVEGLLKGKKCVDTTRSQPICLLTGGLPGSGKSTFLKKYSAWFTDDKVFKIDADEIRAKLPEYKGWNAAVTHLETKDIVNGLLESLGQPCTFDLVYDGTMNKARNYIPLIDKIKKLGYKVFVVYMKIPYEISIQRVLERYEQTGRYVPMEVINDAYDKGFDAFETIKAMVDGYVLVDGINHKILDESGEKIPDSRGYQISEPPSRTKESEEELLLKEKEAEAQFMILTLIKKKLELKNRAQIKNQII